jgi:hypothetical protein
MALLQIPLLYTLPHSLPKAAAATTIEVAIGDDNGFCGRERERERVSE